jgi:hypothetical protein
VLIAIKPLAPRLSVVGSLIAILLFVATIRFLFTTPAVSEPAGGGFPAISLSGEFLLKDVPLLGSSFWTLADSIGPLRDNLRRRTLFSRSSSILVRQQEARSTDRNPVTATPHS